MARQHPFKFIQLCIVAASCALFATAIPANDQATVTAPDPVAEFAHDRVQDLKLLILGPNGQPPPHIAPHQTCEQLYQRRLAVLPQTLNYKPDYWDDPRNRVAVFLGTMFSPAFYFLGYSGVSNYIDSARQIDPRIELDALRYASAQQRCFVN
ncbi:MAG: hypothetical protein AAF387_11335 [Pseudomonadota bacterium]